MEVFSWLLIGVSLTVISGSGYRISPLLSATVEMVDIIRMLLSSSMFEELLSTVCLLELCRLAGPLVGRVWVQSW